MPHDLPQGPADSGGTRQLEQLGGAVVDEEDALVRVERHDALDHAAEDGPQLLAVLLEGADAGAEFLAHAVERPAQEADLVGRHGVDAGVLAVEADLLEGRDQFLQGPSDPVGQRHA